MPTYDRFDICEAYAVLEWDYNANGWLHERPSNVRRGQRRGYVGEATSVQLARMGFKPRPNLAYDTLTENGKDIYNAAAVRFALMQACELCGEPAGEGGALCPACAESR